MSTRTIRDTIMSKPEFKLSSFDVHSRNLICVKCRIAIKVTDSISTDRLEFETNNHRCDSSVFVAYERMIRLTRFAQPIEGKPSASIGQWARLRTLARVTGIDADSFVAEITELGPNDGVSMFFMRFLLDYFQAVNLAQFRAR